MHFSPKIPVVGKASPTSNSSALIRIAEMQIQPFEMRVDLSVLQSCGRSQICSKISSQIQKFSLAVLLFDLINSKFSSAVQSFDFIRYSLTVYFLAVWCFNFERKMEFKKGLHLSKEETLCNRFLILHYY